MTKPKEQLYLTFSEVGNDGKRKNPSYVIGKIEKLYRDLNIKHWTREAEKIDYLDVNKLRKFITEKGKILPRRMTGVCAKHQRVLAKAIKRARVVDLLPFKGE